MFKNKELIVVSRVKDGKVRKKKSHSYSVSVSHPPNTVLTKQRSRVT